MPAPVALAALLLAAQAAPAPGAPLAAAVEAALAVPGGRVEVLGIGGTPPPGCAVARAEVQPIAGSGRFPAHLSGQDAAGAACEAWVWVRVRVSAPSLVASRDVAEGAPLAGAVTPEEREVLPGRPPVRELPPGAIAARRITAGAALEPALLRVGPRPGAPVSVVVRVAGLAVEQGGRAVPCRRDRACAVLPSGRRVEGDWHDGRIEVEVP